MRDLLRWTAASLAALASLAAPASAALETIAADGARQSVEEREGVVFVDLYADW